MRAVPTRFSKEFRGWAPPLALAFALAGCMSSMNDLSHDPKFQPAVATLPATGAPAGLRPAVLTGPVAEAPPPPPPAPQQSASADAQKKKLLTPEEQAKVIAELEALAAKQGAPTEASKSVEDACGKLASKALDPEERLKRERQGLKC